MTRREHLLVIVMEECNEVAQRVSKALRFSLGQVQENPEQNPLRRTNQERIMDEFHDLVAILEMAGLIDTDWDDPETVAVYFNRIKLREKQAKVEHYLQLSSNQGTLQKEKL